MAPRQRNTPATSDDDSYSNNAAAASLSQERQSSAQRISMEKKAASRKRLGITEADIARDNHDYFNIVALAIVVYTISLNYDYPSLQSYTGEYFWSMWVATIVYFFMDLTWVKVVPTCVKSPGVIVKHHIVAMTYLLLPVFFEKYRYLMGAILSVELNTWFLICRRLVYRSYYCPSGYAKVSPIITSTVSVFFYITWVAIRNILYPQMLVLFFRMWREESERQGGQLACGWELISIPVHFALCVLNLKWTYDLFKPIVKRWIGIGPKTIAVQNGL